MFLNDQQTFDTIEACIDEMQEVRIFVDTPWAAKTVRCLEALNFDVDTDLDQVEIMIYDIEDFKRLITAFCGMVNAITNNDGINAFWLGTMNPLASKAQEDEMVEQIKTEVINSGGDLNAEGIMNAIQEFELANAIQFNNRLVLAIRGAQRGFESLMVNAVSAAPKDPNYIYGLTACLATIIRELT